MFFSKCSKFYVHFENAIKFQENFGGCADNWFELVAGVFVNYDKNTCDGP